jgi:hypothetical protein
MPLVSDRKSEVAENVSQRKLSRQMCKADGLSDVLEPISEVACDICYGFRHGNLESPVFIGR